MILHAVARISHDAFHPHHRPSGDAHGRQLFGRGIGLRTYIVEDNATIRENLVGTLEELTRIETIGHAEAEAEARQWLNEHPDAWELAIVDLFLKQGSGLGVLQACATRQPHQKVVVLSNYATTEIRKRCAELGADAVFDKSNEIDALIDFCMAQASVQRPKSSAR
jgi:two-component system, OmpR family, response regulator